SLSSWHVGVGELRFCKWRLRLHDDSSNRPSGLQSCGCIMRCIRFKYARFVAVLHDYEFLSTLQLRWRRHFFTTLVYRTGTARTQRRGYSLHRYVQVGRSASATALFRSSQRESPWPEKPSGIAFPTSHPSDRSTPPEIRANPVDFDQGF